MYSLADATHSRSTDVVCRVFRRCFHSPVLGQTENRTDKRDTDSRFRHVNDVSFGGVIRGFGGTCGTNRRCRILPLFHSVCFLRVESDGHRLLSRHGTHTSGHAVHFAVGAVFLVASFLLLIEILLGSNGIGLPLVLSEAITTVCIIVFYLYQRKRSMIKK